MTELKQISKKINDINALVIGDVILDEYITGNVNRISPEAPVPVLNVEQTSYFPGGAGNTARNANALGANVILAGVIGTGEKAQILKKILKKEGISPEGLISSNRKTTIKSRVIARDQQMIRVDSENNSPINDKLEQKLLNLLEQKSEKLDVIMVSDYQKGVVTPKLTKKAIKIANQDDILSIVDPKGVDFSKYNNCNIISPNIDELALALKIPRKKLDNKSEFLKAGKKLLTQLNCKKALITSHEKGMTLFRRDAKPKSRPVTNNKPRDISGAGDTATAVFSLTLAAGLNSRQALSITNHACGIVVSKIGAASTNLEEIKQNFTQDNYEFKN